MEKEIKFETSLLAREKGYPVIKGEFGYFYVPDEDPEKSSWSTCAEEIYTVENYLPAPTLSELHKWLRDNHNLYVLVISIFPTKHYCRLSRVDKKGVHVLGITDYDFQSYEEAFENGLYKTLELI